MNHRHQQGGFSNTEKQGLQHRPPGRRFGANHHGLERERIFGEAKMRMPLS
jgi:hypothetical protein